MAELRFNPLLRDWTMVAANRQNRPDMPKNYCPFCPGSGKVPDSYDVYKYDNDFPALSPSPPQPDNVATNLYEVAEAYGKCEVILYSPKHEITLPELPVSQIRKVVDLWTERFAELSRDEKHKYVFIFENRGPEVGVTMPHPHGQIYAYPYVPQKIRTELDSCQIHHDKTGHCLICDINKEEQAFQQRMLVENDSFVSYVPFFTDYPYGAFISSKVHKRTLLEFTDEERDDLARMLKWVTAGMDAMFQRAFPYMMVIHQSPVNQSSDEADTYYHFHIEFYPPLRSKDRIKYLASSETGAWAPCNPLTVEDTAVVLRQAILDNRKEYETDE
ncbi:galactose-1-phosphate uridylyltransferase [Alicyclobacillus sp. SO9]|uniref:galactose-1-phosphate uridylyltransferase n=1 Tax=Alicyclobacillus sp. SO9 TaxID=2665646 RepID=UPI0018E74F49|nr:galactose-1-phosphate uridylyltransferase [Alicyclobacillus sp. SO9]QQE77937.1 galactose-1-phosphate uridylyltransferase [Alicyclobacillus sp. SO9]